MEVLMLIIAAVAIITFAIFITPVMNFTLGYIAGIFAKITIGNILVSGLALLGIHISVAAIPLLFGVLNVIGSFFRGFSINRHSSD